MASGKSKSSVSQTLQSLHPAISLWQPMLNAQPNQARLRATAPKSVIHPSILPLSGANPMHCAQLQSHNSANCALHSH